MAGSASDNDAPPVGSEPPPAGRLALPLLTLALAATVGLVIVRERRAAAPYADYQRRFHRLQPQAGPFPGPRLLQVRSQQGEDACPSCHVAVLSTGKIPTKTAGGKLPQPLRPHPGQLLAQHPPGRFLCTSCHGAGGALLDRCAPARGDQDARALAGAMTQASCLGCHRQAAQLPGADVLSRGLAAYDRLGCAGCHQSRRALGPVRRAGPPLWGLAQKMPAQVVRQVLLDPQRVRAGSVMPSFFSDQGLAGAPPSTVARVRAQRGAQVEALTAFLWRRAAAPSSAAKQPASRPSATAAEVARGRELFRQRGCIACHLAEAEHDALAARGLGGVGPDLRSLGQRVRAPWLLSWLQDPRRWNPQTRMPDLRLSGADVHQLTRYLLARAELPSGPAPSRELAPRGQRLAASLGCAGCHQLRREPETPAPVGPELDGFGDKRLALLDWGASRPAQGASWRRWTATKLERPLSFDRQAGLLKMPWQALRPGELQGLVVLLRGLTAAPPPGPLPAEGAARSTRALRRGEAQIARLGCRQCHSIGGHGGAVKALWPLPSQRAPALEGEGAKVVPGWLYGFLRRPTPLRPWLTLRMPGFGPLDRAPSAVAVAHSFAVRDGASFPFVQRKPVALRGDRRAQALALFAKLQCVRCHLVSNAPQLQPGELAPDLALSGQRLRRQWIRRFLLQPQRLMPGTRMPTLFPLADEDDPSSRLSPAPELLGGDVAAQVELLTDLNLSWGEIGPRAGP